MAKKLDRGVRKANGKAVARASFELLKANPTFVKFPAIASALTLAAIVFLGLPLVGVSHLADQSIVDWLCVFVFYLATSFVTFLCNAALIYAVHKKLHGEDVTAGAAFSYAWSRRTAIFKWALFNATVNTLLRSAEERLGLAGRLVMGIAVLIVGTAFNLATFFALPAIVVEDLGFKESVKRSVEIFKGVWGTQIRSGFRIGVVMFGAQFAFIAVMGLLIIAALSVSPVLAILPGVIAFVGVVAFSLVNASVNAIFQTVLYNYAVTQRAPHGFDPAVLQNAYLPK